MAVWTIGSNICGDFQQQCRQVSPTAGSKETRIDDCGTFHEKRKGWGALTATFGALPVGERGRVAHACLPHAVGLPEAVGGPRQGRSKPRSTLSSGNVVL
uniref:Uncharacterized protein n=1 Tax=Eutreptiella gymnastica TaxID=73025 RepID=A0A7S4FVP6_9EUGL